jgi:hypothetical protein
MSETFLERWSRLKEESRLQNSTAEKALTTQTVSNTEVPSADSGTTDAQPIDLTTLPSIDSIGPDSDIRPFLQPGVPEELTGAALRSAWVADPSIRNFVEVADNQWDFNDEAGIPGFGSLGSAASARDLINRALQGLDKVTPVFSTDHGTVDLTPRADAVVEGPKVINPVWIAGTGGTASSSSASTDSPLVQKPASDRHSEPAPRKLHGTALPK